MIYYIIYIYANYFHSLQSPDPKDLLENIDDIHVESEELDIYARTDVVENTLEPVAPPILEEPVQKLSNGRKDNTLVRLKNRIKELELNLSLSSQYVLIVCSTVLSIF